MPLSPLLPPAAVARRDANLTSEVVGHVWSHAYKLPSSPSLTIKVFYGWGVGMEVPGKRAGSV